MSDVNATTPRVFIARHGETEWTITGQFTGRTDIPLTERGILQVQGTGETLVGSGNLLDPAKFAHVFVSPLQRARRTFELLLGDTQSKELVEQGKVTFTEDLLEWDYGEYDGFKSGEIRARRKEKGLDKERPWNQWVDGCEGGEFPEQVRQRVDRLIDQIREIQGPHIKGSLEGDVLVVAHGHILRAFTKRWLQFPLDSETALMMEPGAVGVLSYAHHSLSEPAIMIGIGFPHSTKG